MFGEYWSSEEGKDFQFPENRSENAPIKAVPALDMETRSAQVTGYISRAESRTKKPKSERENTEAAESIDVKSYEANMDSVSKASDKVYTALKEVPWDSPTAHWAFEKLADTINQIDDARVEAKNGGYRPKVLLSYSHRDDEMAKALVKELKKRGAAVWIDLKHMIGSGKERRVQKTERPASRDNRKPTYSTPTPRGSYVESTEKALDKGSRNNEVLVLMGDGAFDKFYQLGNEVVRAQKGNKTVIPVVLGSHTPTEFQQLIGEHKGIDTAKVPDPLEFSSQSPDDMGKLADLFIKEAQRLHAQRETADTAEESEQRLQAEPPTAINAAERTVQKAITDLQESVKAVVNKLDADRNKKLSADKNTVLQRANSLAERINGKIDQEFESFRPEAVHILTIGEPRKADGKLSTEAVAAGLKRQKIKSVETVDEASHLCVLVDGTKISETTQIDNETKEEINTFLKMRKDRPDMEVLPVWIAKNQAEKNQLIECLNRNGLEEFGTFLSIEANPSRTEPDVLVKKLIERARREAISRMAPDISIRDYNRLVERQKPQQKNAPRPNRQDLEPRPRTMLRVKRWSTGRVRGGT